MHSAATSFLFSRQRRGSPSAKNPCPAGGVHSVHIRPASKSLLLGRASRLHHLLDKEDANALRKGIFHDLTPRKGSSRTCNKKTACGEAGHPQNRGIPSRGPQAEGFGTLRPAVCRIFLASRSVARTGSGALEDLRQKLAEKFRKLRHMFGRGENSGEG